MSKIISVFLAIVLTFFIFIIAPEAQQGRKLNMTGGGL
jgi:hypothetical protein